MISSRSVESFCDIQTNFQKGFSNIYHNPSKDFRTDFIISKKEPLEGHLWLLKDSYDLQKYPNKEFFLSLKNHWQVISNFQKKSYNNITISRKILMIPKRIGLLRLLHQILYRQTIKGRTTNQQKMIGEGLHNEWSCYITFYIQSKNETL